VTVAEFSIWELNLVLATLLESMFVFVVLCLSLSEKTVGTSRYAFLSFPPFSASQHSDCPFCDVNPVTHSCVDRFVIVDVEFYSVRMRSML
jgi:hypothetical protein